MTEDYENYQPFPPLQPGEHFKVSKGEAEYLNNYIDHLVTALGAIEEYGTDEINAAVDLRSKLAQARVEIDRLLSNAKTDAWLMSAYHEWCRMNGCEPSSSDLVETRKRMEGSTNA